MTITSVVVIDTVDDVFIGDAAVVIVIVVDDVVVVVVDVVIVVVVIPSLDLCDIDSKKSSSRAKRFEKNIRKMLKSCLKCLRLKNKFIETVPWGFWTLLNQPSPV